jgi:hypothetical protein
MSQLAPNHQSQPTVPWSIEVIPDLMGYLLLLNGNKTYIAKQDLDSLIVALALVKERESQGRDWIPDLVEAIRGQRGESDESGATHG